MKIKLLQLSCMIAGVFLLSFGAGLLSGRIGKTQQNASLSLSPPAPVPAEVGGKGEKPAEDRVQESPAEKKILTGQPQPKVEPEKEKTETISLKALPVAYTAPPVKETPPVKEASDSHVPPLQNPLLRKGFPPPQVKEAGRPVERQYVVQVLSTPNREDAASARNTMMIAGFPAGIFEADLAEKGKWYRIYVGPYNSEAEARAALKSVSDIAGFASSFIKTLD